MRYWVYINDKVEGPYDENKLVTLNGFTPDTLICAENAASGGSQEWVKASSVFEFDAVTEPQPAQTPAAAETATTAAATATAAPADGQIAILLEKLEQLTTQITGLQSKLDNVQSKLDEAIATQNARNFETSDHPAYIPPQDDGRANTITLTHKPIEEEHLESDSIENTENLVSQAENIVAAANKEEKPLDMLGPVDLGETKHDTPTEVSLGSKAEEAVVLRSALDSLYGQKPVQTQEEKESTFQDLLTPQQAKMLADQADANKKVQEETTKEVSGLTAGTVETAPKADESAKEAFLSEIGAAPKEDVLDQVIKEKEEEKKENTFKMAAAAAAGAVAGLAAAEGLKQKEEQPAQGFETVEQAAAEPLPENKTLDFTNEEPALSIAADKEEPAKEEPVLPANQLPADMPADTPAQQPQEQPAAAPAFNGDLPSLNEAGVKPATQTEDTDEKEETMQELVPGAKAEKPEGVLITDDDLNEAFAERDNQPEQSVEQMFGLDNQQAQTETPAAQEEPVQDNSASQEVPQFSDQTADKPLPVGNPNDLTEIELKEGSTYLISDFVPPAQASNELPKELTNLNPKKQEQDTSEGKTELQEMVAPLKQTEKEAEPAADAPKDVTVSQVILENTIKTKRGAKLDIKTVPMVPEPAQTERLHFEGLDDDINTQHDIKNADVKSSGSMTKAVVGILVTLLLAALIYVMLAFMNLIPAQFNLLADKHQPAQTVTQSAEMDEMLGNQPQQPAPVTAAQPAPNPLDTVLNEVKNYRLMNGYTLQQFIEAKHPAAKNLITWDISTAVDPDNYSILVKVPPENPQSFKISYRFNYNAVSQALDPTISDAKNLLDSANQGTMPAQQQAAQPYQGAK